MGYWKFVWSRGTGYGWLGGHPADPASIMCERWSALSSSGRLFASTWRQSGKKMRSTNLPLEHCVGGVVDHVPFTQILQAADRLNIQRVDTKRYSKKT